MTILSRAAKNGCLVILLSIQSVSFLANVSDQMITYGAYVVALIHCAVNLCEWCMVANYS